MARMTGTELLRSLRAEADRLAVLGTSLRDRIDTMTAAFLNEMSAPDARPQLRESAEAKANSATPPNDL